MKLSSYLDSKLIFVNIEAQTKDEVIQAMIERIAKVDYDFAKQKETISQTILEREQGISTAMGNGIMMPHGRVEGYNDVIVAVGVLKEPFECELATKGKGSVKIVFMIVVGKTKNQLMLQIMAALMKLATKQEVLHAIAQETHPEKIFGRIKETQIEIKSGITAEDIMNKGIEPATLQNTLEEIARRLVVENLVGLPVVDEQGKFLGEITERELIQYGLPKYTSVMTDLSFMTVGEPFEAYFKHESTVTVKDLYRRNPITIDRKASIMEISFIMVTKGNTRLYVVENGQYYGMVIRSDIIRKVLHI